MSRFDFQASETEVGQTSLVQVVKGFLGLILWLRNNPGIPLTQQEIFSKFKESMRV